MFQIKVLVENSAGHHGLWAEHGIAYWVQREDRAVLFDTGQSVSVLRHNAEVMEVDLARAEGIVISHGHYDHTGGLPAVLNERFGRRTVWLHPDALHPKYGCGPGEVAYDIGIPPEARRALDQWANLQFVEKPTEILPGIFATGPIPRQTAFEDVGGPFYRDSQCREPDPLKDDQALFLDTPKGVVVLLGCGHAGIINTLLYIQELTGSKPFHMVIGGTHLINADEHRLQRTVEELKRFGVQRLLPAHCTGTRATTFLWERLSGICEECRSGLTLTF